MVGALKQRQINTGEFVVTDEQMELMADAALGPEPVYFADGSIDEDGSGEAARAFKDEIRDRMRGAQLITLPTITDVTSARRKKAFIMALAETGIISTSAARAGWSRTTAYSIREADKDFAARWDEALEFAADVAEGEAARRGIKGVKKAVYFKGSIVGYETVYSDRMLELTLKARRPEKFRDSYKIQGDGVGGVLVVPAGPPGGDWESAAASEQQKYREARDPLA
jgi:hypothetical protein